MANFRIPMTGAQIVDALRQLVNRVAEGWAVGTRDGNPVGSSSPYYNNSAKYWAARAQSAVQGDPAGAVSWDIDQSALSDANRSQARVNIGANVTVVTSASFSSLPQTITNAAITANHVVLNSVLSNPSAQISNWTVTTSNGSLTIAGSISGTTNITLYLYPQA